MEITRENFLSSLPRVRESIEGATFVSLDCEFTGLPPGGAGGHMDSLEERYGRLRQTFCQFAVLQFGLSAFKVHSDSHKISQETYNFCLFPRQHSRGAPDNSFSCQPSALHFLIEHGFNINKTVKHGISHLRPADEERLRQRLEEQTNPSSVQPCKIPELHRSFVDRSITQLQKFLKSPDKELDFDNLTGFQRKLLYDHVPGRCAGEVLLSTRSTSSGQKVLRATRAPSADELVKHRLEKRQQMALEVDEAAGFSRVVKALSASGKPLVGHNMLLDLLLIVHHFMSPLPEHYSEFKALVKCVFPRLIDTKVMAATQPFRDLVPSTVLADVVETLSKSPFSMPLVEGSADASAYSLQDERHHEAGFDAFLTGSAFCAMLVYLGTLVSPQQKMLLPDHKLVMAFVHKIYVTGMYDVMYLDLDKDDVTPGRDHVFHLTFPQSWRTSDLINLFSAFGSVSVYWIDNVSAFVAVDRKEKSSQVLRSIKSTPSVKISTYTDFNASRRTVSWDSDKQTQTPQITETSDVNLLSNSSKKRKNDTVERAVSNGDGLKKDGGDVVCEENSAKISSGPFSVPEAW